MSTVLRAPRKEEGTLINWEAVRGAVKTVASGDPKRVDGQGYKVYKVGEVIRVDLDSGYLEEVIDSDNQQIAEGRAEQEQGHEEHSEV